MRRFDWVITTWFNEFEKNISRFAKAWLQEEESHTAESHRDLLFSPKWKSSHAASKHMHSSFLDSHETSLCEISASTVLLYITRHGRNSKNSRFFPTWTGLLLEQKIAKIGPYQKVWAFLTTKFVFLKKKTGKIANFPNICPENFHAIWSCTTFLWNPFRHNLSQLSVEKRIRVTLETVLKLFGSAEGHPNRCTHAVDNEGTQTFQGC